MCCVCALSYNAAATASSSLANSTAASLVNLLSGPISVCSIPGLSGEQRQMSFSLVLCKVCMCTQCLVLCSGKQSLHPHIYGPTFMTNNNWGLFQICLKQTHSYHYSYYTQHSLYNLHHKNNTSFLKASSSASSVVPSALHRSVTGLAAAWSCVLVVNHSEF